ncbi:hypothetical protein FNF27_01813 [Cafeteria roenbergensis]|nr:hypothetical protein FNF29_00558 [Cafeteria roenbergensis]KAA0176532.1 hypothetical protein FNF27_01813 [Cafeteria roenbergensis]|eukprot:KAA0157206.1 hypothetical protein FNF29_00558 [Cafeteria roenbergensis]
MFSSAARTAARRAAVGAGAVMASGMALSSIAVAEAPVAVDVPTTASYPANHPIEDRNVSFALGAGVRVAAVFDGHGGWQCSDFAMNELESAITAERPHCNTDPAHDPAELGRLLARAYGRLDRDFAAAVRPAFRLGFGNVAHAGACSLTCAVSPDHIVVANAGDCRAVLAVAEDDNPAGSAPSAVVELSRDHNAREPREKERLAAEHPGEDDIVLCKSPTACYVKGRLQPTRCLGDFYLKLPEFNGVAEERSRGRHIGPRYTPPYITSEPELHARPRTAGDRFIVMGSDGLWDAMSSEEAVDFVDGLLRPKQGPATPRDEVADKLVQEALRREAATARMSMQRLLSLPAGRMRRGLHDDITVSILFLDKAGGASTGGPGGASGGIFGWLASFFGGKGDRA